MSTTGLRRYTVTGLCMCGCLQGLTFWVMALSPADAAVRADKKWSDLVVGDVFAGWHQGLYDQTQEGTWES